MELGGRAMLALLLISVLLHTVTAANYTVGGSSGWTYQSSNNVFYDDEFKNVALVVGDVLLFTYDSPLHDVYEVVQADLTACSAANPIARYPQSNAAVTLSTAGYHGFICSIPGHCTLGMHLQVTVSAATSTGSAPPSTTTTPTTTTPSTAEAPSTTTPGSGSPIAGVPFLPTVIWGSLLAICSVLLQ